LFDSRVSEMQREVGECFLKVLIMKGCDPAALEQAGNQCSAQRSLERGDEGLECEAGKVVKYNGFQIVGGWGGHRRDQLHRPGHGSRTGLHGCESDDRRAQRREMHGGGWAGVGMQALVMDGSNSPAWARNADQVLVRILPNSKCRTLQGQEHAVTAEALAPVLEEFFMG